MSLQRARIASSTAGSTGVVALLSGKSAAPPFFTLSRWKVRFMTPSTAYLYHEMGTKAYGGNGSPS